MIITHTVTSSTNHTITAKDITGIILAGGAGRRMGGIDKGWVKLNGKALISHMLERLVPQVGCIVISANRQLERYQALGYSVVADNPNSTDKEFQGPIAGILSALRVINTPYAVIVPVDAPILPTQLVQKLIEDSQKQHNKLVLIDDGERTHPLFSLYHHSLLEDLEQYYQNGNRKLITWCFQQSPRIIKVPEFKNSLINVNDNETLEGLALALRNTP